MRKEIKKFIKICKRPQMKLKAYLYTRLKEFGYDVVAEDGFLFARGSDILVTAHMDTVHKENVKDVVVETVEQYRKREQSKPKDLTSFRKGYYFTTWNEPVLKDKNDDDTVISSPQGIGGDDRCGIYMILKLLEEGYRPTVLFCEDEEIGGIGSEKFTKTEHAEVLKEMKYLIELDRKGYDDAVFYDCGNKDFQNYIINKMGFIKDTGSFSDIGHLSPVGDVASVNLSCGYYKAHTTDEYVIFEEMESVIDDVKKLLDDEKNVEGRYDYQEIVYKWQNYYDDYYGDSYAGSYSKSFTTYDEYVVVVTDLKMSAEYFGVVDATNASEAIGEFMLANPEVAFSYDDILFLGTYDEFIDTFGQDPYDVFGEGMEDDDGYDDASDDFDNVNNFILDHYQKPVANEFSRVV